MRKTAIQLPPPPTEPLPEECCGRGCEKCVYVYYENALQRWQEKVAAILSEQGIQYFPAQDEE